jgi:hypothetical protein
VSLTPSLAATVFSVALFIEVPATSETPILKFVRILNYVDNGSRPIAAHTVQLSFFFLSYSDLFPSGSPVTILYTFLISLIHVMCPSDP